MATKWVENDGGRAEAGLDATGDCLCRAISIASGLGYRDVHKLINEFAARERPGSKRRRGRRSNSGTGVFMATAKRVMEHLGWEWVPTMTIGSGCRVHLRADELPSGRIVARVSKHYVAVIDGIIHDTHDCSRDGTRCVYGYWRAP